MRSMVMPELVRKKDFVLAKCLRQRDGFWFFLPPKRTEKNPCVMIIAMSLMRRRICCLTVRFDFPQCFTFFIVRSFCRQKEPKTLRLYFF
jgi:hypothetical protein